MKPKTLKKIIEKARYQDELSFSGYTEDYLKEEAVKWIKYYNNLENQPFFTKSNIQSWHDDYIAAQGAINFIKDFFGIKDKDLKDDNEEK